MNLPTTGANGFIGRALCDKLSPDHRVICIDITERPDIPSKIAWEPANITDSDSVAAICGKYIPDVIIHCAGIAHQKMGSVDRETYIKVNSEATENLAEVAARNNPQLLFVFLSTISVYGEGPPISPQITQIPQMGAGISPVSSIEPSDEAQVGNNNGISEDADCNPSSDYAFSKLDAEKRLIALCEKGLLHNLIILRLAPVYDREWSLNLDRRVCAPNN